MPWVYILRCADGAFYVGSTRNLEARISDHMNGQGAKYTRRRLPVELVFAAEFERVDDAWSAERQLHGWGRAKRQALIDGNYNLLPALAARRRVWVVRPQGDHQPEEDDASGSRESG